MPKVPTVAAPSVQPQETPLPRVPNIGVDARGLGQGLVNAANAMQGAEDELASIRLAEADTEFTNRLNSRLYSDDDAYFKRLGKDAVTSTADVQQEIERIRDEISESTLTSGRERRLFSGQAAKRIEAMRIRMSAHALKEQRAWDLNTSQSRIGAQVEAVNLNPSFDAIDEAVTPVVVEAAKIAQDQGMPGEAAGEFVFASRSAVYRSAVEGALVQEDIGHAKAVFERFDEHMTREDRAATKRALSVALKASADSNKQQINEVRQMIAGYEEAQKRGWLPDDRQDIAAMVAALDDDTTTNQWRNATRFDEQVTEFAGASIQEQTELLSQARAGQAGGSSFGALLVDQLEGVHEYQLEMAKRDPFRLYLEKSQIDVPDLSTPEGMAQAARLAEQAEADFQGQLDGPVLPAPKEYIRHVSRQFTEATPSNRAMTAGRMLAGYGPKMAGRLFNEIDKSIGMNIGVMGGLMIEGQDDIARMVATGTARLREDPGLVPRNPLKFNMDAMLGDVYIGDGTADNIRLRNSIEDSIAAVYVELRRGQGEFEDRKEGDVDRRTLERAVNMVTGGLAEYNGRPVLLPARDSNQKMLDRWIDNLGPEHFEGTVNHDPDRAYKTWIANGFLQSVGPGRYRPAWEDSMGQIVSFKMRPEGIPADTPFDELPDLVLQWRAEESEPQHSTFRNPPPDSGFGLSPVMEPVFEIPDR